MNVAELVDLQARTDPDSPAVLAEGARWTYEELRARANQFANLLGEFGVEEGDHVALYLPNVPAFLVGYFGALKRGVVPVPINQRLRGDEIAYLLEDSEPRVIVSEAGMVERLPSLSGTTVSHVLTVGEAPTGQELNEALDDQSAAFETVPRQNDDAASLMYTSGTTGHPKGVVQQHGYHLSLGGGRAAFFDLDRADVGLVLSPMFHVSGLGIVDIAVFLGGPMVLCREWDRERVLTAIDRHGVTYAHLITTILVELAESEPAAVDGHDTSSLRVVMTGGGTVTEPQIRSFESRVGGTVSEGYGRTEGGASFNPPDRRKLGSNGVPLYDLNEMKVVDPDTGEEVPPGEEGEIVVRGDAVSIGYYDRPDLNDRLYDDGGWMHTEDLGRFDDDGYLSFTDRMDSVIKTGGENVSPAAVEKVIQDLPGVEEVAVVGVPDDKWGERVTAAVVHEDGSPDAAEIEEHCSEHMAGFKVPRTIVFVDSIPKQGSQKVDRSAVEQRLAEETEAI